MRVAPLLVVTLSPRSPVSRLILAVLPLAVAIVGCAGADASTEDQQPEDTARKSTTHPTTPDPQGEPVSASSPEAGASDATPAADDAGAPSQSPPPPSTDTPIASDGGVRSCTLDSDCNFDMAHTEIVCSDSPGSAVNHTCIPGCHVDRDCPSGLSCTHTDPHWSCN